MSSPPGSLPFYEFPEYCISGVSCWALARAESQAAAWGQAQALCDHRAGSGQEEEGTTGQGWVLSQSHAWPPGCLIAILLPRGM